jgi:UDP-N-acetylglucosamine acyltransferase
MTTALATVHATAIIEGNVRLDEGVEIGAYCYISGNITIGKNTAIKHHVSIEGNTTIGENCEIFQFASIGSKPQDYKFKNEETFLEIGSRNIIREYVTINPGTGFGGGLTKIGNSNLLMISSHIGHDCIVGNNCTIANNVPLGGHVVMEDYITIGGNAAIHQFVKIGSHAMIGGMVGVKENIIPFALVTPCDNSIYGGIRGVNLVGLKRRGFEKSEIQEIMKAYDILSGEDSFEVKANILTKGGDHSQKIAQFVKESQVMEHSKGLAPFTK